MSVSEWDKPITRGGVESLCGEYSLSTIGPSERALHTWRYASGRGLKAITKVQIGNSWELSAVPYIPAVANVADHAIAMREEGVDGAMLSWTLGGYPSPGMAVFNHIFCHSGVTADEAMQSVAERWFGSALAPAVVSAWRAFSTAFSEYPFTRCLLYASPIQAGPSNPLWETPTGYNATMVGYPYDDLANWILFLPSGSRYPADETHC